MALKFEVRHFVQETDPAYSDPEGDSPFRLEITSLPIFGLLVKEGVPVVDNARIPISDAAKLEYLRDEDKREAHTDYFNFRIADIGSERFSNIGTITINAKGLPNAPTVDDNSAILTNRRYDFKETDFIKNFADIDGDSYSIVTIKSLPAIPALRFEGALVTVGLSFIVGDTPDLSYTLPSNYAIYNGVIYEFDRNITSIIFEAESSGYKLISNENGVLIFGKDGRAEDTVEVRGIALDDESLCFDFTTSDDSEYALESNVAEFCLITEGDINVQPPYENKPPTVGDNSKEGEYGNIITFTNADFLTNTNPPYSDPEGDAPTTLIVDTLPSTGILYFNGVPVTVGQEIPVNQLNLLTFEPDDSNTNNYTITFDFRIKDEGSNQYSNTGTFTISVIKKAGTPPTVDDNSADLVDKKYIFKETDFVKNFTDIDGDSFSIVTIKSLPSITGLRFQGGAVSIGKTFNVSDSDDLSYTLPANYAVYDGTVYEFQKDITSIIFEAESSGYKLIKNEAGIMTFGRTVKTYETLEVKGIALDDEVLCFDFTTSDDSSYQLPSNVATFCLNAVGSINVTTPYINRPPTVGDNSFDIGHGEGITFEANDFLLDTTPAYSDPEGDAASVLKVNSLPSEGTLFFKGVEVTVGQEIPISELSSLTFKADILNETAHTVTFDFSVKEDVSNTYSNIGTITINVGLKIANLPTVDDNSGILNSKIFTFGTDSFTKNFADADGDTYYEVILISLPLVPELKLLGASAKIGDKFLVSNSSGLKFHLPDSYAIYNNFLYKYDKSIDEIIADYDALGYKLIVNDNRRLVFRNIADENDEVSIMGTAVPNSSLQFKFRVTDSSELHLQSNIATFSLIPQGNVNIKPIYTNDPPVVGDNRIKLYYNEVRTFNQAHFVEDTTPPYYDPQTDAPYELKVLTLPPYGQLFLASSPISVGQIISFVDIRAGLFKYAADSNRTDISYTSFEFAVSDIGSKEFSE